MWVRERADKSNVKDNLYRHMSSGVNLKPDLKVTYKAFSAFLLSLYSRFVSKICHTSLYESFRGAWNFSQRVFFSCLSVE